MLTVTKVTESRTNSEADTKLSLNHFRKSNLTIGAIYRRLIHRTRPNRPHISSVLFYCQKALEDKNIRTALNISARPDTQTSEFSQLQAPCVSASHSPLHHPRISAPPVRGLLRTLTQGRKLFLKRKQENVQASINLHINNDLRSLRST